jgi:hypothetical protein
MHFASLETRTTRPYKFPCILFISLYVNNIRYEQLPSFRYFGKHVKMLYICARCRRSAVRGQLCAHCSLYVGDDRGRTD